VSDNKPPFSQKPFVYVLFRLVGFWSAIPKAAKVALIGVIVAAFVAIGVALFLKHPAFGVGAGGAAVVAIGAARRGRRKQAHDEQRAVDGKNKKAREAEVALGSAKADLAPKPNETMQERRRRLQRLAEKSNRRRGVPAGRKGEET